MGDLTEGVQTIISIMKSSTTGIGTTGYEITDDNASGLTISGGQLLVTASLSKDELKDQFGGTQDYDVIMVVRSEEIEDDWIGLSTKSWKEKVIIEVNVIDKWSAVATKYITGDLVRYKAVNAIRKFIKANTSSPGGTINNWQLIRVINEEDKTTRPITYKAKLTTEAWMYYNPNTTYINGGVVSCATGEQVSNGDLEDGDFSGWINDRWGVVTDGNVYPKAGTYCAKGTILNTTLKQQFNIYVECFTVNSTAEVNIYAYGDVCGGSSDEVTITLTFDNGYTKDIVVNYTSRWDTESFLQTILDEVTAGNILTTDKLIEVKFTVTGLDNDGYVGVDDLTIEADGT